MMQKFFEMAGLYALPSLVGAALYLLLKKSGLDFSQVSLEIEASAVSAVIGYAFAALFFMMALPREGFLKAVDDAGLLIQYAICISLPAVTGIFQISMSSLSKVSATSIYYELSRGLFLAVMCQFLMSIVVVFLILRQFQSGKNKKVNQGRSANNRPTGHPMNAPQTSP